MEPSTSQIDLSNRQVNTFDATMGNMHFGFTGQAYTINSITNPGGTRRWIVGIPVIG